MSCFRRVPVVEHRGQAEATISAWWKGVGAKEGEAETRLQVQVAQSKACSGLVGSKSSTEKRSRLGSRTSSCYGTINTFGIVFGLLVFYHLWFASC